MKLAYLGAATVLLFTASAAFAEACPPDTTKVSALRALKSAKWKLDDTAQREALATALVPCLASRDPELRDGIAFEALSTWLRGKQLSPPVQQALFERLLPLLKADAADPEGFTKPFAALALSEVARADRISPFLTTDGRAALVDAAVTYMQGITDYRGFSENEGWRHGVAHGADLLMQLALNPTLDGIQLKHIANAVRSQVAPASGHFYIFGESERLARPILFAARRNTLDAAWWADWLQAVTSPTPALTWESAFGSTAGLSRLHNTKAFLMALYLNAQESRNETLQSALLAPVRDALLKLP